VEDALKRPTTALCDNPGPSFAGARDVGLFVSGLDIICRVGREDIHDEPSPQLVEAIEASAHRPVLHWHGRLAHLDTL
jgi:hypothetical protein